MLKQSFFGALAAGVMLTVGAGLFLSQDNILVSAVFFSVALMVICMQGMYLFTGKIGMLAEDFSAKNTLCVLVGLLGNYITATLGGLMLGLVKPSIRNTAVTLCTKKLDQNWYTAFVLGVMCGILMYSAVKSYAVSKQPVVLVFCVAAFILSGYEHSIADMTYFGAARIFNLEYVGFIFTVILGNTVGGMILPIIMKGAKNNEAK